MKKLPPWFRQLSWIEPPRLWSVLDGDRNLIDRGSGLYVFLSSNATPFIDNVLYVGKADGRDNTLRQRLPRYFRRFRNPSNRPPTQPHAGMEQLNDYCRKNQGKLFVTWACVIVARELEGDLIHILEPPFNNKEERTWGDKMIPPEYLP